MLKRIKAHFENMHPVRIALLSLSVLFLLTYAGQLLEAWNTEGDISSLTGFELGEMAEARIFKEPVKWDIFTVSRYYGETVLNEYDNEFFILRTKLGSLRLRAAHPLYAPEAEWSPYRITLSSVDDAGYSRELIIRFTEDGRGLSMAIDGEESGEYVMTSEAVDEEYLVSLFPEGKWEEYERSLGK